MAVLLSDSCDYYNATADLVRRNSTVANNVVFDATNGRFGGKCVKFNGANASAGLVKPIPTPVGDSATNKAVVNFAFKPSSGTMTGIAVFSFIGTDGFPQLSLTLTAALGLDLRRGASNGTVIASAAGTVFTLNAYSRIEFEAFLADAAGTARVWVDGNLVIDFTGDTKANSTGTVDKAVLAQWGGPTGIWYIDDMLVYSTSGIAPNVAPLGDIIMEMITPTGAGSLNQGTVIGAASPQTAVSESSPDGDGSYISSSVAGDTDLFQMSDLVGVPTSVIAVNVIQDTRSDAPGAKRIKAKAKVGAASAVGATLVSNAGTNYVVKETPMALDPSGVAWTGSTVNSAEFGFEVG